MKKQTASMRPTHHHHQTVAINLSNDSRQCLVTGYINFKNVMKLRRDGKNLLNNCAHTTLTVDLHGIEGSDNSGLVLLVAWLRDARELQKKIVYSNAPEFLQAMAQVFGLSSILFKTQGLHG